MSIIKDPIALNYCANLNQLCGDLIGDLDLGCFCYHRMYRDGSELMLSNIPEWTKQFHEKNYLVSSTMSDLGLKKFEYLLTPINHRPDILVDNGNICNIEYGLACKFSHEDYYETYGFSVKKENILALTLLLNNVELLKNFSLSLAEDIKPMILQCDTKRIRLIAKPDIEMNLFFERQKELLQKPALHLFNSPVFSRRETDCIKHLLLGKTATQIGDTLFISRRTVETHMENIKNKIGCSKKSEVIFTLFQQGFAEKMFPEWIIKKN
jgi:LuxR family quorum-sensing system transcriptional regulator SolR